LNVRKGGHSSTPPIKEALESGRTGTTKLLPELTGPETKAFVFVFCIVVFPY